MELQRASGTYGDKRDQDFKECQNLLNVNIVRTLQHVMVEYKTLLMKMAFNGPTNDKANFDFFYDV